MEKHYVYFAGRPPVMRDPRQEKRRDHRRRAKRIFGKENKWNRTLWKRKNRSRFRNIRDVALARGDMEHFDLHVDIPKTSGWWTW